MNHSTSQFPVGEAYSDEQIEELLQRAQSHLGGQIRHTSALEDGHSAVRLPRPRKENLTTTPYVSSHGQVARVDSARLLDLRERRSASGIHKVEDPFLIKQRKLHEKNATAGEKWFKMPKTQLTPELKRDLQLIKMRNVLDPHRHYKKESTKTPLPKFSQVGTLVEGPTEFFSGRLQNSQRKRTLVEEILASERQSGRFKRKYGDIQKAKTSGRNGHYKTQTANKHRNGGKRVPR